MLAANLRCVKERMAAAAARAMRRPEEVKLLAVSKGQPAAALAELAEAGQRLFGENYLQEAEAKMAALKNFPHLIWHFIGPLQGNKAARVVEACNCLQSLHKKDLAQRLNRLAGERNRRIAVLIQVNLTGETSKSGCSPEAAASLAQDVAALPNLELRGLMTLPPFSGDAEATRPHFARLRALSEQLARDLPPGAMHELSMGMSEDFEAAIEEGATLVRIGSILFGPRG